MREEKRVKCNAEGEGSGVESGVKSRRKGESRALHGLKLTESVMNRRERCWKTATGDQRVGNRRQTPHLTKAAGWV